MKQKLNKARTLAIQLYNASRKVKLSQPPEIWGRPICEWRHLPSESVDVWDAVAIRAYDLLKGKGHNDKLSHGHPTTKKETT
jgi:hypothetical protein